MKSAPPTLHFKGVFQDVSATGVTQLQQLKAYAVTHTEISFSQDTPLFLNTHASLLR